ncbi:MAG: sodium:solute symporter family protein [Acidobacteriota bacterium]
MTPIALLLGVYAAMLATIAVLSRRAATPGSLSDFYLAGRSLGVPVLVLTLYATQYSGNALIGYPGEAYRMGFAWIMSASFMMAIVVVYLTFAPGLQRTARKHRFVTPADWFDHRFGSPVLTHCANLLLIVAITNYLLAQLMAIGHLTEGISDGAVPYAAGVLLFAVVIVVYETLGGLRAVAWTDTVQGILLLVGLAGILAAVLTSTGGLGGLTAWLAENHPEKVSRPPAPVLRTWVSNVLTVGFAPQAIQRIYAAKSSRVLKRSLGIMAFMPLVTMPVVVLVGLYGVRRYDTALGDIAADQVMPRLLREWTEAEPLFALSAALVLLGAMAAIMSTADSVLLSLSSILSKDVLGRTLMRDADEAHITRYGKLLSWLAMAVLVGVALVPRLTLWGLTELKNELLCQVSPLFVLGVAWSGLTARAALCGLLAGTSVAAGAKFLGFGKIWGLHAGLYG